jgi:hypothetical protein
VHADISERIPNLEQRGYVRGQIDIVNALGAQPHA